MDTNHTNQPRHQNNSLVFDQTSLNMIKQKLVVVGDISVGKTTIVNCLLGQKFKDDYEPSVGVDFFTKNLKFKGKNIKLQIWDSAGQEKYRSLIKNYIRGSSIIFIVYDITNKKSFEGIHHWIRFIKEIESCLMVICGNKIDMNEMRKVDFNEGEKLAKEYGCYFFEVSAKAETNINKMLFQSVISLPMFESFRTDRPDDLLGELEVENNETKANASSFMDSIRHDIQLVNDKERKKQKCNC